EEGAAIINGLEQVEHARVLAKANPQSQSQALHLVAYYVPAEAFSGNFSLSQLKALLADILPAYMQPSLFIEMEDIPLTANGKIDKRALPAPDWQAMAQNEYVEPQGELENSIAAIWAALLGLERVG